MKTRTYLKTGEAAEILEVSPSTARDWADRYGLGRYIGAHLRFDPKKTERFALTGDEDAQADGTLSK